MLRLGERGPLLTASASLRAAPRSSSPPSPHRGRCPPAPSQTPPALATTPRWPPRQIRLAHHVILVIGSLRSLQASDARHRELRQTNPSATDDERWPDSRPADLQNHRVHPRPRASSNSPSSLRQQTRINKCVVGRAVPSAPLREPGSELGALETARLPVSNSVRKS